RLESALQDDLRVLDMRSEALRMAEIFVAQGVGVELAGAGQKGAEHGVLARHDAAQPLPKMLGVEQLADANAARAADLVLVARADAAAGGADRGCRAFVA